MRTWIYTWASSDGLRHEGELRAKSKDAAYAYLRTQGIRAIRVVERIRPVVRSGMRGLRKRDVAIIVFFALALVGVSLFLFAKWFDRHQQSGIVNISMSEGTLVSTLKIEDPAVLDGLRKLTEQRKAAEDAYRQELVDRVRKGSISRATANEIFRAMKLPEIKEDFGGKDLITTPIDSKTEF